MVSPPDFLLSCLGLGGSRRRFDGESRRVTACIFCDVTPEKGFNVVAQVGPSR